MTKENKKYYVVRFINGKKTYKRTKCSDYWTGENHKDICWQFTKQAAKRIAESYENSMHPNNHSWLRYDIEEVA